MNKKNYNIVRFLGLLVLLLAVVIGCGGRGGEGQDGSTVQERITGFVEPIGGAKDNDDSASMSGGNNNMSGGNSMSGGDNSMSGGNNMSGGNSMMGGGGGNNMMGSDGSYDPIGRTPIKDRHLNDEKYTADQIRATELVIATDRMAKYLATQEPDWQVSSHYDEAKDKWYVDFYDANGQWFGFGGVKFSDGIVDEMDLPEVLETAQAENERELVRNAFLADEEVAIILGDSSDWYINPEYDQQDATWYVYFERGIESWEAHMIVEQGGARVYALSDPMAFTEEERNEMARDRALELASSAEGLWETLETVSEWQSFVEHLGESEYSVSYVSDEDELFYAVVDVDAWEVLEFGSQ